MTGVVYLILLWVTFHGCRGENNDPVSSAVSGDLLPNSNISNETITGRQAGYGLIRFEGQTSDNTEQQGFVNFADDNHHHNLNVEDTGSTYGLLHNHLNSVEVQNGVSFQDDSSHNLQNGDQKKRKRRRRRKSRRSQYPGNGIPPSAPEKTKIPSFGMPEMPRGPLRTITDALTSIVDNDTKRCVSRMLCEQVNSGALNESSGIAQTIIALTKYLPLLQRSVPYSTLPLIRSVYLLAAAMKAGGVNQSSCSSQYPECPSDPEERIHYFNNHNGGFFRFFRGTTQHQYTAEEFHNNLLQAGLKPHSFPHHYYQQGFQQANPTSSGYGVYNPNSIYQTPSPGQYALQSSYQHSGYDAMHPYYQSTRPNPNGFTYGTNNGAHLVNAGNLKPSSNTQYGSAYPHFRRYNYNLDSPNGNPKSENSDNKIQRRILNKPEVFADNIYDDDKTVNNKWSFPIIETPMLHFSSDLNKIKTGKQLKFPGEMLQEIDTNRQAKGFSFPGDQSYRQYLQLYETDDVTGKYENKPLISEMMMTMDQYNSNDSNMKYNIPDEFSNSVAENGVEIVYVVRGNGDPSQPEIVKLRPGEKIH